jgi:hypothetical protein
MKHKINEKKFIDIDKKYENLFKTIFKNKYINHKNNRIINQKRNINYIFSNYNKTTNGNNTENILKTFSEKNLNSSYLRPQLKDIISHKKKKSRNFINDSYQLNLGLDSINNKTKMNINYLIKTIEYNPPNNNNNLMTKINKKNTILNNINLNQKKYYNDNIFKLYSPIKYNNSHQNISTIKSERNSSTNKKYNLSKISNDTIRKNNYNKCITKKYPKNEIEKYSIGFRVSPYM